MSASVSADARVWRDRDRVCAHVHDGADCLQGELAAHERSAETCVWRCEEKCCGLAETGCMQRSLMSRATHVRTIHPLAGCIMDGRPMLLNEGASTDIAPATRRCIARSQIMG
jgi:hypothetical protein